MQKARLLARNALSNIIARSFDHFDRAIKRAGSGPLILPSP
jgi:hypothetical protein